MKDLVKASLALKTFKDAIQRAERDAAIVNKYLEERRKQPYERQIIPEYIHITEDGTLIITR